MAEGESRGRCRKGCLPLALSDRFEVEGEDGAATAMEEGCEGT
jgi:hypothetical protein